MEQAQRDAGERRLLLFILIGAVIVRLVWLAHIHGGITAFVERGEATLEAYAVAEQGSFADAYYRGYGPSAHLLPVMPAIAGALLRLFGSTSAAAQLALLAWSLAQVICGWLLMRRLFDRLGTDPQARKLGLILLALIPVFAPQETVDFRWWEGALAVCLGTANLLLILKFEDGDTPGLRPLALAALLWAITAFVNPVTGLAAAGCWAVYALRRLPFARAAIFAGMSASLFALIVAPWAIRNAEVLGTPVLLRSNFGLEMALANHPGALNSTDPAATFRNRLTEIHPYHANGHAALERAGGEVVYSRALGAETRQWIAAHPFDFALLSLHHISEFFFPRPWQMHFAGWDDMRAPRAIAIALIDLLGLIGLAVGLRKRRRGYAMLALFILLSALPYAIVQPVVRYTYLVYGLLAYLAADWLVGLARGPGWAR